MDDARLRAWIGEEAHDALVRWACQKQLVHRLDRPFLNGRSGARTGVVDERDGLRRSTRKLVLKLDGDPDGGPGLSEYARGHRAARESADFARRHLAELVGDPLAVGADRWITFQRIAGGSLGYFDTLAELLTGLLTGAENRCSAAQFAKVVRAVVHGVLAGWAGEPDVEYLTVPEILRRQLGPRMDPGMPLERLARSMPERNIPAPDGGPQLVNPFALLLDEALTAGVELAVPVGRSHGDLHPENILVRVRPGLAPADFRLVDLAKYEQARSLTWDPALLVLAVAGRALEHLTERQREALADVVLDPSCANAERLPPWLPKAVAAADLAAAEWIGPSGFLPAWREQRLVSLVACALAIRVRGSTRPEDHAWFLLVAARAATALLEAHPVREGVAPPGSSRAQLAIADADFPQPDASREERREIRRAAVRTALERSGVAWSACETTDADDGLRVVLPAEFSEGALLSLILRELERILRDRQPIPDQTPEWPGTAGPPPASAVVVTGRGRVGKVTSIGTVHGDVTF